MRPPSYMRSVVDRNVVMRRMTVFSEELASAHQLHAHIPYAKFCPNQTTNMESTGSNSFMNLSEKC